MTSPNHSPSRLAINPSFPANNQPRSAQPTTAPSYRTLVAARGCCRSCPPAPTVGPSGYFGSPCCISTPALIACCLGALALTGPPSVVIGPHSRRPSRCLRARQRPHQFGSGQHCRTRSVIERASRAQASTAKYAASRPIDGCAADAANAAPWCWRVC